MKLNEQTLRLIAVGASVVANCQPCLEINVASARECGADEQDIAEAIQVGKRVRKGAAAKMDTFAEHLNDASATPLKVANPGCECGA